MKVSKLTTLAALAVAGVALSGCGGGSGGSGGSAGTPMPPPVPPPPPTSQLLMATDVLAMAKLQSDTTDPFAVNGGAATLVPADDESSDPIAVE